MIHFYLKPAKRITRLVMMRIYDENFKKGVFNYSTREKVDSSEWKNDRPKTGTALAKLILDFELDASEFMRLNRKTGFDRKMMKDHLDSIYKPKPKVVVEQLTLIDLWRSYHKTRVGTVLPGTLNGYKNAMEAFEAFIDESDLDNLTPAQFDLSMYREYLVFLKDNHGDNTCAKYLATMKMFLTDTNTKVGFDNVEKVMGMKEMPGVQIALTEEELTKLYHHKFEGVLDIIRWLFFLQCYTGLRISDFKRLDGQAILRTGYIRLETKKVKGIRIDQPLTPVVREILMRFNGVIPKMRDDEYRLGIKEVYKAIAPEVMVEIRNEEGEMVSVPAHTEISTHDAIRTFVSTLCHGMSMTAISKMVGKSVSTIIARYLVNSTKVAQKEMSEKFSINPYLSIAS